MEFTIKDNNAKSFRSFGWFLLFLHIIAAAVVILRSSSREQVYAAYGMIGTLLLLNILYFYLNRKADYFKVYQIIIYVIFCIFWLVLEGISAMLICAIILSLSWMVQCRKTNIRFTDDAIIIKGPISSKTYPWKEIEHAILKDNLLTIEFISNRLIQVEIVSTTVLDEAVFNAFVLNKIHRD